MSRARPVYVVNSRLPVSKVVYGDGIGDVITGLFTRVAPKILPIGKKIASKAIGVVRDRVGTAIGNTIVDTFSAAKEKLMSLLRGTKPVKLQSTDQMPPKIGSAINKVARQRLRLIAGCGIKRLII